MTHFKLKLYNNYHTDFLKIGPGVHVILHNSYANMMELICDGFSQSQRSSVSFVVCV